MDMGIMAMKGYSIHSRTGASPSDVVSSHSKDIFFFGGGLTLLQWIQSVYSNPYHWQGGAWHRATNVGH